LVVMAQVFLSSCAPVPVERHGISQLRIVTRVYATDLQTFRVAVLNRFGDRSNPMPSPFQSMRAIQLSPPNYPPDWLTTWIDPSGYLESYKRIPASLRAHDLLIEEPTFDLYWPSEYSTATGTVKFRCGFILHFAANTLLTTEVQVYEKAPEIWVGEHWGLSRHGIGFGKFHDIRPVEPTVKDRMDMLNLLSEIARI
jgi:hypothetical protein